MTICFVKESHGEHWALGTGGYFMSPGIYCHTPTLAVIDPRRLPVRTIAYHRALTGDITQERVSRQGHDAAGHLIARWDPRLWFLAQTQVALPANQTSVYNLSGQVLANSNVDSGWRVNLPMLSGQVLQRWDSRGSTSRLEYDVLLRPVAIFERARSKDERCVERLRYADASPEAATHNLCCRLIRHDDPAGSKVLHEASLCGDIMQHSRRFLIQETAPDWPLAEPSCDALLEPGAGAFTSLKYSALGESLAHTDAMGHRQRSTYNVTGQLNSIWLQLAGQAEQRLLSQISYNAFGQIDSETAGNGVITIARYSPVDARLQQLLSRKDDGTLLQDLNYGYDPVGNILSISDDAQSVQHFNNQRIAPVSTYQYDSLYQLVGTTGRESAPSARGSDLPGLQLTPVDSAQLANYTRHYSYDASGNLTILRHVGAQSYTREMLVAAYSNRSVVKDEGGLATAFDGNGNLQQLQPGQGLNWDLRNQLHQVTPVERADSSSDNEVYIYDSGGQRVRKIRHSKAHSVVHRVEVRYLPSLELRTNTATGETLQVLNVVAGRSGVRVLHWQAGQPDGLANDQLRYSLGDHLGCSSIELDQQAQLISQEGYYPYGGSAWWVGRNAIEANYKTIRYSGRERDATGLYYYGLRYYAPWLQRWTSPDPAGVADGLNLYGFVANNPLKNKDHLGLMKYEVEPYSTVPRTPAPQSTRTAVGHSTSSQVLNTAEVDSYRLAYDTIWTTRSLLYMGAGNQIGSISNSQEYSMTLTAMLRSNLGAQLTTQTSAAHAVAAGTGNCDEYAAVSSSLVASSSRNTGLTPVHIAQIPGHTFALLGDPHLDPLVIDPWVTYPMPHKLSQSLYPALSGIFDHTPRMPQDPQFEITSNAVNPLLPLYQSPYVPPSTLFNDVFTDYFNTPNMSSTWMFHQLTSQQYSTDIEFIDNGNFINLAEVPQSHFSQIESETLLAHDFSSQFPTNPFRRL